MKKPASAADPLWYKDAIIYELHVRAFADSNGDGIGDFQGLLSKLDYLQELGVTCIWLLPFFPSPLRDDGYDIASYMDVNPSYGTLADFKAFLDAAHVRGMQVMIELVINHTSDQHPWFKAARLAPAGSPQREMYVWSDTDQLYKDARIIFTDTEKSNWTWDETARAYYWHRFFSHQPDLNFDNPLVIEEVLKAMRFWLDMGVDGLRMDAIPYLCERDGTSCENLPETHAVIRRLREAIDAEYDNRMILAEANQWPADVRPYFGDGDECHMAFHFPLMPRIYMALRQEDRLPITDIMAHTPAIPESCQWGLFLRNHDELTLEMVTDDERDYMYFAYSADPRMRVNVGIRRRLAPLVDNNRRRIELLNSLLLSFPGTPILYYGDEIGMGDNIYLGDRNGVRTPMQWTSDRNAGFSRCDPARLYFPVIMDPIYGYQVVNVEAQLSDQSSLLHWTRNMIALRKLFQVFGRGSLTFLNPANRKVLAYLRDLERPDGSHETVLCVANLSRFAQPVSLDLAPFAGMEPVEMLGYVPFPTIAESPYALTLAPYSFLWLELQPAGSRSMLAYDPESEEAEIAADAQATAEALINSGWSAWLAGAGCTVIERSLAEWMPRQRWFGAKARTIKAVHILHWAEMTLDPAGTADAHTADRHGAGGLPPLLLFVAVNYGDGTHDEYQVPVSLSTDGPAERLAAETPQALIAQLDSHSGPAVLHDATVREDLRQLLLALIARGCVLPLHAPPAAVEVQAVETTAAGAAPPGEELAATAAVAPAPITAQPGEAATPPRSSTPAVSSSGQRTQPRESPTAGNGALQEGRVEAHASPALTPALAAQPASRVGSAEQSNTSILYGGKLILKLFRRLQPGENPDVEIGRFLTETAQFNRIAPLLGEITMTPAHSERTTLGMLQGFVASEGDGWSWFLAQAAAFYRAAGNAPRASAQSGNDPAAVWPAAAHAAKPALQAAALLGQRTAEMHLALATPTQDAAFAAEPVTHDDLEHDARRIEAQLTSALALLRQQLPLLDEALAESAIQLLARRRALFARAESVASQPPGGQRIRIHGDYHLGQTLRTADDFVLLDFEGEPARTLEERRRKQSPLKDVAGMVRSFSYAAFAARNDIEGPKDALSAWVAQWQRASEGAFLAAYWSTIAERPELLPARETARALLDAYLLEKALYELVYELNNRPAWLGIPLSGILSL
ncbi:MAG TPA: maltose alpha-D-glucosyltransferase [Terracidiphilus sp.]|nr:maltose alpha-D-glucosyltransferase [Terracidiphilus sp.]